VWAWKKNRVKKVEAYCDVLASIFPFENQFYNKSVYVGNPLLDEITTFKDPKIEYNSVAFLPGSRKSEIKKLMPIFRELAKKIDKKKTLIIPNFFKDDDIKKIYGDINEFTISRNLQETLSQSDFAFVCSGTATLEAAIIGTPFVLAYKAKKIDYFIGRQFVKLSHVGLANIIMDFEGKSEVHQEFLQDEVTVENLFEAYQDFDKDNFHQKSKELKEILRIENEDNSIINYLK
jgi:lipid-A-disaccharide synthase